MHLPMAFLAIAHSSSWDSPLLGIRLAATWDYLSEHMAAIGNLSLVLSRHCSAKTGSLGALDSQGKASRVFTRKSATVARRRGSSRSGRSSDTLRTSRRELTIRIVNYPQQQAG